MNKKILHGNKAKIDAEKKIDPVYQTLTLTSKQESNSQSVNPVTSVIDENVYLAKKFVDDNHK